MTKSFNLRNAAVIFACLAVTATFFSCEKESKDKQITDFSFATPQAVGVINESAKTIVVSVPESTDVTALVPTITVSEKATVSPSSGVKQDFTNPITYTVTAEDGSITEYTVTVTEGEGGGGGSDIIRKRPAVYSMSITGSQNSDLGYHVSYTKLSIMTADGYYEKTDAVDTELSSTVEEWFILATNTYYWQGSAVNLKTGQSGSGSTSETYSSREQTLYYANLKAVELNADMVWSSDYTIVSVRTGSETFLGRDCAKFVYEANSSDINRKTEYWIDKATGACLKHIDDLQTTDGYVKTSWACTEFKIGGVSLPPHE